MILINQSLLCQFFDETYRHETRDGEIASLAQLDINRKLNCTLVCQCEILACAQAKTVRLTLARRSHACVSLGTCLTITPYRHTHMCV